MLIREDYLSKIRGFYNSDLVKILVGIRRCGKSVILNQIIDELKDKGILEKGDMIVISGGATLLKSAEYSKIVGGVARI